MLGLTERRLKTEKTEREAAVDAVSCCEARAYAFVKQADRITRYYDRDLSLSFSSRWRAQKVLCAAAFGKSDNLARQWAGKVKRVCPSLECPFATQWLLPGRFSVLFRRGEEGGEAGFPPLRLHVCASEKIRERNRDGGNGEERSELNGRDPRVSSLPPLVRRFRTPAFRKWDHRAQRAAEAASSAGSPARLEECTPRSATMSLINRRVYTQSTTNHIYPRRGASSADDGENGDDLYLGIAETWPKFVTVAEEDGCQLPRRAGRNA